MTSISRTSRIMHPKDHAKSLIRWRWETEDHIIGSILSGYLSWSSRVWMWILRDLAKIFKFQALLNTFSCVKIFLSSTEEGAEFGNTSVPCQSRNVGQVDGLRRRSEARQVSACFIPHWENRTRTHDVVINLRSVLVQQCCLTNILQMHMLCAPISPQNCHGFLEYANAKTPCSKCVDQMILSFIHWSFTLFGPLIINPEAFLANILMEPLFVPERSSSENTSDPIKKLCLLSPCSAEILISPKAEEFTLAFLFNYLFFDDIEYQKFCSKIPLTKQT